MLFFNHPKSIVDPRPVAMKVVKHTLTDEGDKHILLVEPNRLNQAKTPDAPKNGER